MILGFFFNNFIFTNINSVTFCNKFLNSEIKEHPILSMETYIFALAVIFIVGSFLLLFYNEIQEETSCTYYNIKQYNNI